MTWPQEAVEAASVRISGVGWSRSYLYYIAISWIFLPCNRFQILTEIYLQIYNIYNYNYN